MINFREYAENEFPREACAFVAGGKVVPVENLSETPEDEFFVQVERYQEISEEYGKITAFLHSHPGGPNYPSKEDMEVQMAMGVPCGICSVYDGESTSIFWWGDPEAQPPLVGRGFQHGVTDCYALVRDWYYQERGISLKEIPRSWEWWPGRNVKPSEGSNLYLDNFGSVGFESVGRVHLQEGDLLLASLRSSVPNHGAIYLGDDLILHHPAGKFGHDPSRLSIREPIARWMKHITHVLRYRGAR